MQTHNVHTNTTQACTLIDAHEHRGLRTFSHRKYEVFFVKKSNLERGSSFSVIISNQRSICWLFPMLSSVFYSFHHPVVVFLILLCHCSTCVSRYEDLHVFRSVEEEEKVEEERREVKGIKERRKLKRGGRRLKKKKQNRKDGKRKGSEEGEQDSGRK